MQIQLPQKSEDHLLNHEALNMWSFLDDGLSERGKICFGTSGILCGGRAGSPSKGIIIETAKTI
jgi:hypothetical protein